MRGSTPTDADASPEGPGHPTHQENQVLQLRITCVNTGCPVYAEAVYEDAPTLGRFALIPILECLECRHTAQVRLIERELVEEDTDVSPIEEPSEPTPEADPPDDSGDSEAPSATEEPPAVDVPEPEVSDQPPAEDAPVLEDQEG